MVYGNVRDLLGQQSGEKYQQNHGTWCYDLGLGEILWYDMMRVSLHGLQGREGCKAYPLSLIQASLLKHS
jgi:hypothetical protein